MARPRKRERPSETAGPSALDERELIAAVCKFFCLGQTPAQIVESVRAEFGESLTREEPYRLLAVAANLRWLQFVPPPEYALAEKLRNEHVWLDRVDVAHTVDAAHVASRAARTLLDIVRAIAHGRHGEASSVHIGLSGGHTVRAVMEHFGDLLREPAKDLPREIVFHAMVTGMGLHEPSTEPNTFCHYVLPGPALQVRTDFIALHAPPVMLPGLRALLEREPSYRQAFDEAAKIDVMVTSASSWLPHGRNEIHSQLVDALRQHSDEGRETLAALAAEACEADLFWQPLGRTGPIDQATGVRALSLVQLAELPSHIVAGTKVLCVLAPCGRCGAPKADVLSTILRAKAPLITHLVVDSRSARLALQPPRDRA